ncbi:MAG: hypothetical protein KDD55_10290, partial [Bdellovibrionales bacterium]|nr:hypothetical protein [Bdellovibrionales bacterium]
MAHINPRAAAAIAALALGGSPDTDASLTPEPTKETSTEHAAGNLPPAPPEFTRDEVAAVSLFDSLLQDSSKPVETLPTEKDSGVKKEATGAPAEESAEYSRAAARGLVPPSGSVREQEIRAKAAEKIDAAFNPDGPWGARTTGATPTGSGARSGAADPSPAPGGTTGSKTDPGPAPKVEQLEILSAGEGKWADPTQNLAISSVNDAKLYESYNFLKKAGVDITYRNTGTITFTAQYAIEPEYEQQYIDAKQALGKFADFDLLRSEDGKLIAVFDTVTVSRKDNRGQALPEDVYHEKAKDALASMLQHTRGTLQRIETSPLESDTIAPARDFSTMSRADMEKVLESVQRERFAAEQEATLKLDLLSRLEGRQGNVSQMNGQVNAWAGQSERSLG